MTAINDAGEELQSDLVSVLLDRFRNLEISHAKLREQFELLVKEQQQHKHSGEIKSDSGWSCVSLTNRYRSVLDWMGHAVIVTSASSGEIVYWNRSAEKLYGWKNKSIRISGFKRTSPYFSKPTSAYFGQKGGLLVDSRSTSNILLLQTYFNFEIHACRCSNEVLGQSFSDLLIDEEYYKHMKEIMDGLTSGHSWSGQFPFKKRSGEVFMAMVTKSPLYEDGEVVGVITVSSDAAVFNHIRKIEHLRAYQGPANGNCKVDRLNLKKIQWPFPPQITSMPQIASSVSNLASKVRSMSRGDNNGRASSTDGMLMVSENASTDLKNHETILLKTNLSLKNGKGCAVRESSQRDEHPLELAPSKIATKFFAKLRIRGSSSFGKERDDSMIQSDSTPAFIGNRDKNEPRSPRHLKGSNTHHCNVVIDNEGDTFKKSNYFGADNRVSPVVNGHKILDTCESQLSLSFQLNAKESHQESLNCKGSDIEYTIAGQANVKQFQSSGDSSCFGHEFFISKLGDIDSNSRDVCDIRWEDIHLGEELGQGSHAVVYHGIWNGSDVAVKLFFRNDHHNETLLDDYKTEIDIMRRLRHPNVLLFMGAIYSQERLGIVTEILPRGSLFKVLHKNNQSLDIHRRLKMALDVARGMNYLHRRNPPIVHRDLKTSNLLVDRNWTVKVGDFGLSRFKKGAFLTTKSASGTPQWMAPEVLRSEPSNEKSDVYSFGVILWELMTECIPWSDLIPLQVVGVVGFMDKRLDIPEQLDPHISAIIRDCWLSEAAHRPSFEDIIQRITAKIPKVPTMSLKAQRLQFAKSKKTIVC